ncbi:MAG TPA: peptidoglycan-binding domain-containing protein [Polyangia bacterium]
MDRELENESRGPLLRLGSRGPQVTDLQRRLAALGFNPGPADGVFGPQTATAVRSFQIARRLEGDGIVGSQTWGALGRANFSPTPPPAGSRQPFRPATGSIHLQVPFRGYQSNDRAGCFRRCIEMAAAVGVQVGGSDVRIQIALREDSQGRIVVDPVRAREGRTYIEERLFAGEPVVVGVSYKDSDYNVDDITDHFVIITGRDVESDGEVSFRFHDPASSRAHIGSDSNRANRFFVGPAGALFRSASSGAPLGSYIYDVAMVRRNS